MRPILPLSWSLIIVFAISLVVTLWGHVHLFKLPISAFLASCQWFAHVPEAAQWVIVRVACCLPPALAGFGGFYEGAIAESTFNQWQHFIAFVILLTGLYAYKPWFQLLVHYAPV